MSADTPRPAVCEDCWLDNDFDVLMAKYARLRAALDEAVERISELEADIDGHRQNFRCIPERQEP